MSVHTRTRHTRRASALKPKKRARVKTKPMSTPWREVFKDEIEKYSEAGLMLRGSRYKAEMTQKEVADALGVSQNHISEMENGKRTIGRVMALRLAKLFNTDYRKFL